MQKCKRNLRIAAEFGHAATHSTHMAIIKPGSLGRHRLLADFGSPKRKVEVTAKSGQHQESAPEHRTLNPPLAQTGGFASPSLNNRLTEWWTLDFAAFRSELRKALKAEIPVKERADWEAALVEWQRQHTALTTRLVAIETDIDDRVCRLFGLTPADRRLLSDHSRHAMIDYPYGAV